jgi:hypothetical protein
MSTTCFSVVGCFLIEEFSEETLLFGRLVHNHFSIFGKDFNDQYFGCPKCPYFARLKNGRWAPNHNPPKEEK